MPDNSKKYCLAPAEGPEHEAYGPPMCVRKKGHSGRCLGIMHAAKAADWLSAAGFSDPENEANFGALAKALWNAYIEGLG